ncbi:MAG: hypothetical protein EBR82_60300 [Caulobacteraceae bacterium]|jgi:hypothetical protein|nr:hypothetical protein [Caulobacteraceae bacterium]
MPVEDKKKDPMVDVGEVEGADVELESKENTEAVASAEKEEPIKVEESVKEEKTIEAKKEDTKEIEKEAEEYSEGVQRRIAKLTKKWREAERQKEEALRYAQIVKSEKENMSKKFSALETTSVKDREAKIVAALEAAKSKLGLAREAGDISAEIEISKEIAKLGYEEARLSELKSQAALLPKEQSQIKDIPVMQQQASAVPENIPTDGKAESWAANNRWFGTDKAMTYTAFDIHRQIVDEEGYDPKSDEYYAEIDKRIRLEFPHKFGTNNPTESARPVQTVASSKRSTKPGRKTVRLTPSQVAIAKKLGVPLEEYAKQLNITKEV